MKYLTTIPGIFVLFIFFGLSVRAQKNVGIGTMNPTERLHVNGPGTTNNHLRIHGGSNGYVELLSKSPTYGVILRAQDGSGHFANIEVENNTLAIGYRVNTEHITIEQGGNVGIGKANPEAKLDVNSAIGWGTQLLKENKKLNNR